MPYADSSSGRSHRSITASTKVLDPSNTAHALSSHWEGQKRAIEEACLRWDSGRWPRERVAVLKGDAMCDLLPTCKLPNSYTVAWD